jgi:mono/diheme cytochrome c family protein
MSGFDDVLTPEQISALVLYTKSLSTRFADQAPPCLAIPDPPPVAAGWIDEGRQAYRFLGCWSCHGTKGEGDGPLAKSLMDDRGEPTKPRSLARGKYKCGGAESEIYRTLHVGLAGTPMGSFAETLAAPREAGDDLKAIRSELGAAGAKELAAWLQTQPDAAALSAWSESERQALVEHRTWALVRYVLSLSEK